MPLTFRDGYHVFLTGKMGDIIYALPAVKALARKHGPIHFMTSGICHPIVPLLREQPYLASVDVDEEVAYRIVSNESLPWFEFPKGVQGINLSVRPEWIQREGCWTKFYAEEAGVTLITDDKVALPSLVEHRLWFYSYEVFREGSGIDPMLRPNTAILAPEAETLPTVSLDVWVKLANALKQWFKVMVVGLKRDDSFPPDIIDMRGMTTVPSLARLLAEARIVITSLSLPFHLARHSYTPTFVLADMLEVHSFPTDTISVFYRSEQLSDIVETARRHVVKD